jgi:hypothetical protein
MYDLRAPFHHWTRPWTHSGACGAAQSTHTHSIERAKSLASTTEVCKNSTEARAQRDAEVPGGPEITARAQRSTEREPWADQQKEPIDERCTNHGPNELRTRKNAARHVRHVRVVLGMRRGSRGCAALKHKCSNRKAAASDTTSLSARAATSAGRRIQSLPCGRRTRYPAR